MVDGTLAIRTSMKNLFERRNDPRIIFPCVALGFLMIPIALVYVRFISPFLASKYGGPFAHQIDSIFPYFLTLLCILAATWIGRSARER